jgi:hypothetical protein
MLKPGMSKPASPIDYNRTNPLKNIQAKVISQELLWRTLPWSAWRIVVSWVRAAHLR